MDFQDESYVRLYTRDTRTWLRLGFEGQCVLTFLIRKLDRAGVLDGIEEPAMDVALVTGIPVPIVEVGLARLLERGVVELHGAKLVMPNYVEAQNCRQTDRLRKAESRAVRSAQARVVTKRDDSGSQNVTESHQPSPTVTNGHPSLTDPSLTKPSSAGEAPDTRAPVSDIHPAPVPGLVVVGFAGTLQPSRWDQAAALPPRPPGPAKYGYDPDWGPTKANQARGHEIGLTDDEIWARWNSCRDKPYPHPFHSDEKQFNRELGWAAADKTKNSFQSRQAQKDFETPGHRRRA